jgi:thiol peroxidase
MSSKKVCCLVLERLVSLDAFMALIISRGSQGLRRRAPKEPPTLDPRSQPLSDRTVTMRGAPLPLAGAEPKAGDAAPDFKLHQRSPDGLKDVTLKDYEGKTLILSVVPSLDTPVCEQQTMKFNEEILSLPAGVEVLTVSMDLPFAQARFCSEKSAHHVSTASDHRDASFGRAYGVLIEPLRLLARSVFVVDGEGTLKYAQIVPEVTEHPDYPAAIAAAREAVD